ncbi:MAG: M23 family metallopeptidase [Candidatus Nanopelagicales bacterium]
MVIAGPLGVLLAGGILAAPAVAAESADPISDIARIAVLQSQLSDPFNTIVDVDAQRAAAKKKAEEKRKAAERKKKLAAKKKAAAKKRAAKKAAAKRRANAGASRGTVRINSARVLPVPAGSFNLTARFGQAGNWSAGYHTGLDFAAPIGTTVRAARAGTVVETGWGGAYGNRIVLDHGNGVQTTYNHLSSIDTYVGAYVSAGTAIGCVGTTGNSTGPHLHFEVQFNGSFQNPAYWLGM